jgi:ubiquinone biosynthesis O-methyltransferase
MKSLSILDVGCGAGLLSESLGRLGTQAVTGIDPTPKCIELAQAHLELDCTGLNEIVKYENTTLEAKIEENEEKFDVVCCSEVIEHVNEQSKFLQDCAKLVKPNGFLFMSTIAKTPEAYLSNIVLGEYVLGLLPKGTHEYEMFISHEQVQAALRNEMELIEAKGVSVKNPITMEMQEVNYLRANYMMIFRALK